MNRIKTISPDEVTGLRKLITSRYRRKTGGYIPGILNVMLVDLKVGFPASYLYNYLHLRKKSPLTRLQREMIATVVNGKIGGMPWLGLHTAAVRRLTGDEHLDPEFATTWPEYDLDEKTRALLEYATTLTEYPANLDDETFERLKDVGWDDDAVYEATALISFFNFTGRMEAATGMPLDEVPNDAKIDEGKPDNL